MSDVTHILRAIEDGEPQAAAELLPVVYDELRNLAAARMASEKSGQTLQATALVHEAWLRLVDAENPQQWANRKHFFAAAAAAMRRILIDNARRRCSEKRGGELERHPLFDVPAAKSQSLDELADLDEALQTLAKTDPVSAEIVNLRYFVGLSVPEVAELLELSPRTVDRYWSYARAWLHQALIGDRQ